MGSHRPQPRSRGEYQRFLYAVDSSDGSVMVFDVTEPSASPRTPMQRPHPELNPLSAPDRLSFASPVASLAFATHDWPIIPPGANGNTQNDQVHAYAGLLCNPNPNAVIDGGAAAGGEAGVRDYGFYYTAQQTGVPYSGGTEQAIPLRLRGVFAFATLTTGEVITIDVDDWDAPCPVGPIRWPSSRRGPGTVSKNYRHDRRAGHSPSPMRARPAARPSSTRTRRPTLRSPRPRRRG